MKAVWVCCDVLYITVVLFTVVIAWTFRDEDDEESPPDTPGLFFVLFYGPFPFSCSLHEDLCVLIVVFGFTFRESVLLSACLFLFYVFLFFLTCDIFSPSPFILVRR